MDGVKALKEKNFRWDIARFPQGPDGDKGFGTGGSGYAITKTSKNKKCGLGSH